MTSIAVDPVPSSSLRNAGSWIVGLFAAATGATAAAGLVGVIPAVTIGMALGLHALAALLAWGAAAVAGRLPRSERNAIVVTSLAAPLFGPALAWTFNRRRGAADAINAHAWFESLEHGARFQRSTMTGDFDRDLSRELSVISYAQILRQGTLDRKRNLLRRLAALGSPQHLEVIRHCLRDPEPELRLCAYAELDRLSHEREETISKLHEEIECLDGSESDEQMRLAELLSEMAASCRGYAVSGILDDDMSRYWLQQAVKAASQALEITALWWPAAREKALALAELQEFGEAWGALGELEREGEETEEMLLVRADIACRRRDFSTARSVAGELRARDVEVPGWLAAVGRAP